MRVISVTDLKLVDSLSHLTYIDIINPANDVLLLPVLEELGFDTDYPIQIDACQHRNLQNKVVVNYLISGEMSLNRKHVNSVYYDAMDRAIAASYTDRELAKDLLERGNVQVSYETLYSSDEKQQREIMNILDHYCDPEESERITKEIDQLNDILYHVRGSQFLKSGAYKMHEDYHKEEEHSKPRKKKQRKFKLNGENN